MLTWLTELATRIFVGTFMPVYDFLTNGGSRYFWVYCVTGLMIAAFAYRKHAKATNFETTLLDRNVWLSASALNDYVIVILTPLLRLTVLSWTVVNWKPVSAFVATALHSAGVTGTATGGLAVCLGLALTICLFVADDFMRWYTHYTFHRIPELWEFHKVHHSAEVLNFATAERHHPIETIVSGAALTVTYGLVNGLFIGLFGDQLTVATVAGANVFLVLANVCGGVLRHSPFWVSFGPAVERWVISPAMHQIHHSNKVEHYDRNYGSSLSVWDRMAGSLHIPRGREIEGFGIGEETEDFRSLSVIFLRPFGAAYELLRQRLAKPQAKIQNVADSIST